jgi:hypothetical protein
MKENELNAQHLREFMPKLCGLIETLMENDQAAIEERQRNAYAVAYEIFTVHIDLVERVTHLEEELHHMRNKLTGSPP